MFYCECLQCEYRSLSFPVGGGSPPWSSPGNSPGVSDHFGSGGLAWSCAGQCCRCTAVPSAPLQCGHWTGVRPCLCPTQENHAAHPWLMAEMWLILLSINVTDKSKQKQVEISSERRHYESEWQRPAVHEGHWRCRVVIGLHVIGAQSLCHHVYLITVLLGCLRPGLCLVNI